MAERLLKKRLDTQAKIMQQKEQLAKDQLLGCTFHPQLVNRPPQDPVYVVGGLLASSLIYQN